MQKNHRNDAAGSSHILAIESLAAELHMPVEDVWRAYEKQLARLTVGARVHEFLTLFAMRKTRVALLRS
jgi:hypothetical protein